MPQLATITSFYTFTGNTKARATNVNTNFSNFRGHLLPIDPNTISCIGDTYDIGSVEYRFNKAWVNYVEFDRPTTTCSVTQFSNTAVTAGSLITQINSNTVSDVSYNYNKISVPLTSGVNETKIGGLTACSIKNDGAWFKRSAMTTAASALGVARLNGHLSTRYTTIGTYYVSGATISLDVVGKGSLVEVKHFYSLSITSVVHDGIRYTVQFYSKKSDAAGVCRYDMPYYNIGDLGLANNHGYNSILINLTAGLYYFYPAIQISSTNTALEMTTYLYVRETL